MKKILILPLFGIGDVLMTTPAIRNLKEQLDVEITYLHMFKTTRDILLHNPYIHANIHFPFLRQSTHAGLRFLLQFRKRFDCSINFYPSNRKDYNAAQLVIGSPMRVGHRYVRRDILELNFLKNRTIKENDALHNVEENLSLLQFLGIKEATAYPMEIYFTEEEKSSASQWLKERVLNKSLLIGIHPGTSTFKNHGKRRWSESSFADLISRLAHEVRDSVILLLGGPEEQSLRNAIVSLVHDGDKVLSVDSASIRQSASLISKCSIFISNDSGLMHCAAALQIPTIAIFGPTNPVWVRPWGVKHRIVRTGIPCSPCFRYSPLPLQCVANRDYACHKEIRVEQVLNACLDLMKETCI
jgi:ADP-heptose:LPS heptosyltransferase